MTSQRCDPGDQIFFELFSLFFFFFWRKREEKRNVLLTVRALLLAGNKQDHSTTRSSTARELTATPSCYHAALPLLYGTVRYCGTAVLRYCSATSGVVECCQAFGLLDELLYTVYDAQATLVCKVLHGRKSTSTRNINSRFRCML